MNHQSAIQKAKKTNDELKQELAHLEALEAQFLEESNKLKKS